MYSKEDGTPASKLPEQIHGNTKKSRYNQIMKIQQKISNEKLKEMVSSTPTELPVFTLNNADEIEYRQLEKILEIIDREEKLGFDYSSASDDKPLVLKRKLK